LAQERIGDALPRRVVGSTSPRGREPVTTPRDEDVERSSRRAFMGVTAKRSAAFAVEVAGMAAGLGTIEQMAESVTGPPDPGLRPIRTSEQVELLDRRDPSGASRIVARSTSELLRRYAEGAVADGPLLAVALAGALPISLDRAIGQGQPSASAIDYATATVRDAVGGQPAIDVLLDRVTSLTRASAAVSSGRLTEGLTAEAKRLERDIVTRHGSVADQAARRVLARTESACDLLLVGDGSRYAGAGTATTTAAAVVIAEAGRLRSVSVLRAEDDDLAARWMALDLVHSGIAVRIVSSGQAVELLAAEPTRQVLLAPNARLADHRTVLSAQDWATIAASASRVTAVVTAFGEYATAVPEGSHDVGVDLESVVG
jgi:hypothetical protein